MAHYLLHDLPGASFPAAAPQSPIIFHPEEQAAWVTERAEIWRKIVAASDAQGTEQTVYRTNLFNSPEQLRRFWKSPDEMEEALTLPGDSPSVTAKGKTDPGARSGLAMGVP